MALRALNIKQLFQQERFLTAVLIILVFFQLVYSFLFPYCGRTDNWLPVTSYLPKFARESTDNFLVQKILPLISNEYRLNSDAGNYLELARYFDPQHFKGHVFLNRPLYPFLIFLFSLPFRLFPVLSFGVIFGLAILVNFLLMALSAIFFFLLLNRILSRKVAFFSSLLLIFSPFVHTLLVQPLSDMFGVFSIILGLFLLYQYVKHPSSKKLIVFSLIIGVLMLGKMLFAISFFILLLAVFFKRRKEGLIFLVVHLIPFALWYLWLTWVWHVPYSSAEVSNWQVGIWLLNIFHWPFWETARVFLRAPIDFIKGALFGFLLLPVLFSIIGVSQTPLKRRYLLFFGFMLSVFALYFLVNLYFPRYCFLIFPVIYPAAVLGIERIANGLKRYQTWAGPLFFAIAVGLIIIISNANISWLFSFSQ